MAYCRHCGSQIDERAVVCVRCGCAIDDNNSVSTDDKRSGGFAFLCFLFPIVGLILYLVWKDEKPLKAKSCAKGAIIGVVVSIVFGVLGTIFRATLLASLLASSSDYGNFYDEAMIFMNSIIH